MPYPTNHKQVDSVTSGDPSVRRTVYFELREQQREVLTASSPVIDAFDKRAILERTDPLLALAYYVEAVADGRATNNDVDAYSKIAALQQEARRMLRQVGAPLSRVAELYPRGNVDRGV